ncbi:MAG: hypothetical protein R3E51_15375 [Rhizobiaceae bacterium]
MRYYFDFQDEDGHGAVDDDGIEFSTFEEARSAAARALSEHALEVLPDGHATRLWVDVRNGDDASSANCSIARTGARAAEFHTRYADRIRGASENRSAGSISLASSPLCNPVLIERQQRQRYRSALII